MIWSLPILAAAGIVLVSGIAGYRWMQNDRSRREAMWMRRLEVQREQSQLELLQIVSHLRHDWMNDIQVLSGYIQLKKYDKLYPYVEKIRAKMQNESNVSKLGVPSLVAYLLSLRTDITTLQLDVELEHEINLNKLPLDGEQAASVIRRTVELFKAYAQKYTDEPNTLSLELIEEEQHLLLDFAYHGNYNREALRQALEQELLGQASGIEIEDFEFEENKAAVAVRLPYRIRT
jgi:sensor histidine kinase regulating citrate/malate metabolism